MITRAAHQCESTGALVRQRGGVPVVFPCLHMHLHRAAIAQAIMQAESYSDVLLTSVNTVHALAQFQLMQGKGVESLFVAKRVACVGEKTAAAMARLGVRADLMPTASHASQQALIEVYEQHGWPQSLLFLRAESASELLTTACRQRGVRFDLVPVYSMTCPQDDVCEMRQQLASGKVNAVLLGSSRTAEHYVRRIGDAELASRAQVVVISQQVADVAEALGLRVRYIAARPSFASMLDALSDHTQEIYYG